MKTTLKRAALGAAVLLGMTGGVSAAISLPLQPGYAVHTFGVSPDADSGDDRAVLRIYDTHKHIYQAYDNTAWDAKRPVGDFSQTRTYDDWTIEKIGNVYGIAIDQKKNIYVAASANWSPGYTGQGESRTEKVSVRYGDLGGGDNNLSAAGTIYKIDGLTGAATPFAVLPQKEITITHQVCGSPDTKVQRQTGPGLGNIVYDAFHHQFFVSNFSDGKIYRIDEKGVVNMTDVFNTSLGGVDASGSAYGLALSPQGDKLFFGTIEIGDHSYKPGIFSVDLNADGSFKGHSPMDTSAFTSHDARLVDNLPYTQNIGGSGVNNGVWAAFSDLTFTPDGELMAGVRVGCEDNFATSYNHGGVVYLLQKNDEGKYNKPSAKTTPTDDQGTTYSDDPVGTNDATERAGHSDAERYDAGSIPLRFKNGGDQNELAYGPDDGYGGVAIWQDAKGTYDLYATSSDISTEIGVHGFMQFNGNFTITDQAALDRAAGFKAVKSSTTVKNNENKKFDYKGIGGDVEVLSVVPVSIGSCVWVDENKNGIQDEGEAPVVGAKLTLKDKQGKTVATTQTQSDCTYEFTGLAEGDYRVCVTNVPNTTTVAYTKTPVQNGADNDDTPNDSNFMSDSNCSGLFTLVANSEPVGTETKPGDDQDDAHDTWGNMTVDFGYVKNVFDLALVKKLVGGEKRKVGDKVTFTITVTNQGNVDATNVEVSDYIPEGLTLADAGWTQSADGETATKSIGALAAGASKDVTIVFTIDRDYQGTQIVNRAEITDASNDLGLSDIDSTPGNKACSTETSGSGADNSFDAGADKGCDDIDPAKISVEQHFDLAIKKQVDAPVGTKFKRGDNVTFIITVYNQGTVTAKNIQIRDMIPEGLTLNDSNWNHDGDDAVLKRPIAALEPGKSTTRKIVFTIKGDASGKIVNTAEIMSASNDQNLEDEDSTPGNGVCADDQDNKPEYAKGGCDDSDPAQLKVDTPHNVSPATDTPNDENDAQPNCDCAEGDAADAMSSFALLLMLLGTLIVAMRFRPKDMQQLV